MAPGSRPSSTAPRRGYRPPSGRFPFRIGLRTGLLAGRLRVAATVTNTGDGAMPMGLGFHPYFPTPLGPSGEAERCQVWIDADEVWERGADGAIAVRGAADSAARAWALSTIPGRSTDEGWVRNLSFRRSPEDVGARYGVRAGLRDDANGLAVQLVASAGFGVVGLYTPPSPPVVALEPMTGLPDALNLAAAGHRQCGLIVLHPGEVWRGWIELSAHTVL